MLLVAINSRLSFNTIIVKRTEPIKGRLRILESSKVRFSSYITAREYLVDVLLIISILIIIIEL